MPQNKPDNSFAFTKKPLLSLLQKEGVSNQFLTIFESHTFCNVLDRLIFFCRTVKVPFFDVYFFSRFENKPFEVDK